MTTTLIDTKGGAGQPEALIAADVGERLSYDPETGLFRWRTGGRQGLLAGWVDDRGYRRIEIAGRTYYAHRLVWLYVHGLWPEGEIDHINHNRDDNRIVNLRVVSHDENGRNYPLKKNNTSGVTGVSWHRQSGKWRAKILVSGQLLSLGLFNNIDDAALARRNAEIKHGFHRNHGKSL